MKDKYSSWIKEAANVFEVFNNNKNFEEILNRFEKMGISPSSKKAAYYYYGKNESIVDTRRLMYYKNFGLFKLILYFNNLEKSAFIKIELIRRAEDFKKRIQDTNVLFNGLEVQLLFEKRTFNIYDYSELNKFFDLLKIIKQKIDQYQLNLANPLKISSIEIFNFKNIKEGKVEFKKNFQLLVGSNNAGKTSLIQGLLLAFRGLEKLYTQNRIDFEEYRTTYSSSKKLEGVRMDDIPFVVQNYRELFNVNVKASEYNKGVKFARFEFTHGLYIELDMYIVGENLSIRIRDSSQSLIKEKVEEFLGKNIGLIPSFFNITINEERKTKRRYVSMMRSGNYNQLFRNILLDLRDVGVENEEEVTNDTTKQKINDRFEILRKNVQEIFNVNDLEVQFDEEIDEYIKATHTINGRRYDISGLGMGALQFIQVVAQALIGNPFLLILDEPDAHLNTNLQVRVIEFFKMLSNDYNIHLLIATHSNDIISCAQLDEILHLNAGRIKRIGEENDFQEMIIEIGSTHEDIKRIIMGENYNTLIITEGKTDWKHLKHSLERFYSNGEFLDLNIKFLEYENEIDMGGDNLVSICKQYSKIQRDNKIICIFDRDDIGTISKLGGDRESYKNWGNNVFSVLLPIPEHRLSTPKICIEHYYTDEFIKTCDSSGRRLYIGSEFSQKSGLHISEDLFCVKKDKCGINSIMIIDDQVYRNDNEEANIALTKNNFANNILNESQFFSHEDNRSFRRIFEIIQEIEQKN
ncbi:ATP-dependent endonuclease [Paenibacillus illinoisensis]|uniref:ATP-dependent nuclease n=1 Tax=Paenibacillus illinoisensis TaxID=59845 RepID=UPI001C8EA64D|nr:AAA family ATPase [Paenibacillus illinoisensis]MBY0217841.1 AAA family ATPase [Paenibacillus illinoisensis]